MLNYKVPANEVIDTLKKHIPMGGFHIIVDLERSRGTRLVDAATGKEYIDFFSYWASLPVGHNHPKLLKDKKFMAALTRAAVANPNNTDIYSEEYAAFVKNFARLVKPAFMKHLFFIAGGSLAVENALKTAFDWKVRKNRMKGVKGEKGHQIIHFRESFHGRSGYALSLTNTDPVKVELFPKFKWPRIINPKLRFPVTDEVLKEVKRAEKQALNEIKRALKENRDDIAALIIEPIQSEGGDNHFRKEFLRELRALADENEFLLIFDEVQTGMGITGKLWAYEHFVKPDIIAFGKKTQVCGIMCSGRIDDVPDNVFVKTSRIATTWGGNLVDMIRGVKYAEVIREDGLVGNAAKVGARFLAGLRVLEKPGCGHISNVRGRGLFIGLDMPDTKARDDFRARLFDNGVAALASGPRSVRFRSSLNISAKEIDEALGRIEKSL